MPRLLDPNASTQERELVRGSTPGRTTEVNDDTVLTFDIGTVKCKSDQREITITLPRAASCPGHPITVFNVGQNTVFVQTSGGSTIMGDPGTSIEAHGSNSFTADDDVSANQWLTR